MPPSSPVPSNPSNPSSPSVRLLASEWVLPVTSEPIRDGVVAVEGSQIAWVGRRQELPSRFLRAPLRAFPRSLLLPGWVNAHSHLNLTAALGLAPGSADHFVDWIRGVIRLQQHWPESILRQSIVAGLDLLVSTGTTTVAHVSTLPPLEPFLEHRARAVVFHEAIGFRGEQADDLAAAAEEWLDAAAALVEDDGTDRITLGVAPHAPYSASPELIRCLGKLAAARGLPLSMHLAETTAEREFLQTGGGPFRELLESRGAWDPDWKAPQQSPIEYAHSLGLLSRPDHLGRIGTAVHCNYVTEQDAQLLARGALTPVWCPGSHYFFGHREYPARRLLDADAPIALGTDSLASNAGLNMLREVRLAAEAVPEIDPRIWLRAATLWAAEALGLGKVTGSLEPGKAADLQVLEGVPEETTDPLAPLLKERLRVRAVLIDGIEVKIR